MSNNKSEVFFDKTVFGGYDPEQVDEFVNEARKMLTGFKKENQVLKQKLQVLAEALEEARNVTPASEGESQSAAAAPEAPEAVVEQSAAAPAEAPVEDNAVQLEKLNQQLSELLEQIQQEQNRLSELRREHAAFIASLTEQYELQLRELGEASHVSLQAEPVQSDAAEAAPTTQPVEENDSVQETSATDEAATQPSEEAAAALTNVEPASDEPMPSDEIQETATEEESAPSPKPVLDAATVPSTEPVQATEDAAPKQETAPVPTPPVQPEATAPAQCVEPVRKANPQPVVDAGESVYLNAQGVDTSNLSYEEALALVLKKNGILSQAPDRSADELSDSQATKIIPRIPPVSATQTAAPAPSEKAKKPGFFHSLKSSIRAFLDEDEEEEEDVIQPVANKNGQEELQFGKAYNVKNDR